MKLIKCLIYLECLEKENFTTLMLAIFSAERDPESNISPQQNMLQILSICESFI